MACPWPTKAHKGQQRHKNAVNLPRREAIFNEKPQKVRISTKNLTFEVFAVFKSAKNTGIHEKYASATVAEHIAESAMTGLKNAYRAAKLLPDTDSAPKLYPESLQDAQEPEHGSDISYSDLSDEQKQVVDAAGGRFSASHGPADASGKRDITVSVPAPGSEGVSAAALRDANRAFVPAIPVFLGDSDDSAADYSSQTPENAPKFLETAVNHPQQALPERLLVDPDSVNLIANHLLPPEARREPSWLGRIGSALGSVVDTEPSEHAFVVRSTPDFLPKRTLAE